MFLIKYNIQRNVIRLLRRKILISRDKIKEILSPSSNLSCHMVHKYINHKEENVHLEKR